MSNMTNTQVNVLDRMTYKRIYFLIIMACIIAAFGLIFGNGDINIYLGSSVGVLSGVYVLSGKISKLSPSSGTLLFFRTLCDVGVGIRLLFHGVEQKYVCGEVGCRMEADKYHDKEDRCQLFSAIFEFFQIASEMWLLCVALDLAVTMSNPFSSFKARLKKYHALVWLTALFFALILALKRRDYGIWGVDATLRGSICWFDSDPDELPRDDDDDGEVVSNVINHRPFVYFYIPVIVFYCYIIYVMICAKRILSRGIHTSFLHRIHTLEISRFILKVFLGYWFCQACCYFTADLIYSIAPKTASYIYEFLLFGMSAKGFPCLLVYLILLKSENRLIKIAEANERGKSGSIELNLQENNSISNPLTLSTESAPINDNPLFDVNTTLQHQVFVYITLGMKTLAKRHTPQSKELVTIRFRVPVNFIVPSDDLKAITSGSTHNLEALVNCNHDEVLSNIIEANAELSNYDNQPKIEQDISKEDSNRPSTHFNIEELENQHENARMSVTSPHRSRKFSLHNSVMLMSGENSDVSIFDVISSALYQWLRLSSIILELNDSVEFTEYLPSVFQSIRLTYGVLEDYAVAFEKDIQSRVTEGGASDALFFYSQCGRFIAKSCTTAEMLHIRKVAPKLDEYFREQKGTLITKIFGAYKLKMYACDLYFIVTNNVKYTIPGETITDVYDLKGSSINRFMKLPKDGDKPVCKYCGNKFVFNSKTHIRKKQRKQRVLSFSGEDPRLSVPSLSLETNIRDSGVQRQVCPMFRHEPEAVLKDNDLRARARFRFSSIEAHAIKKQLYHDSNFLRDLGVMDYSLLVAVYKKVTPLIVENSKDENDTPSSSVASRRVQAVEIHAEYAYYLGIIDYQQEYNFRKKVENFVKVNISGEPPDELSCVNPEAYSQRFYSFLCELVSGDGPYSPV